MAILEVKNLRKSFGKTEVLKGIDFSLEKGEVLSIIGSSGSGKTTLLRCLNFLETAENGTISVNGKEIFDGSKNKKYKEDEIRKNRLHFGLVFQNFNLFPQYNVLKNVTLAPTLMKIDTPENIEKRGKELIETVGLTDRIEHYPCQLSGGQQQRVAIARALINEPSILLADEPTGNLDNNNAWEIMKLLEEINAKGTTVIVVTHNLEIVKVMKKRVITVKKGTIVSDSKQGGYDDED